MRYSISGLPASPSASPFLTFHPDFFSLLLPGYPGDWQEHHYRAYALRRLSRNIALDESSPPEDQHWIWRGASRGTPTTIYRGQPINPARLLPMLSLGLILPIHSGALVRICGVRLCVRPICYRIDHHAWLRVLADNRLGYFAWPSSFGAPSPSPSAAPPASPSPTSSPPTSSPAPEIDFDVYAEMANIMADIKAGRDPLAASASQPLPAAQPLPYDELAPLPSGNIISPEASTEEEAAPHVSS